VRPSTKARLGAGRSAPSPNVAASRLHRSRRRRGCVAGRPVARLGSGSVGSPGQRAYVHIARIRQCATALALFVHCMRQVEVGARFCSGPIASCDLAITSYPRERNWRGARRMVARRSRPGMSQIASMLPRTGWVSVRSVSVPEQRVGLGGGRVLDRFHERALGQSPGSSAQPDASAGGSSAETPRCRR
jgi:hypothetical protein